MPLKATDVEALIELFTHSTWDELHLEIDGEELLLSNDSHPAMNSSQDAGSPTSVVAPLAAVGQTVATIARSGASPSAHPSTWVCVKAPMLGTFYTSPSPDAPPYITVGARVTKEAEVCMIEVMKLFTTVQAGVAGTVREITAQDGDMVEYDQPLLWVEPN